MSDKRPFTGYLLERGRKILSFLERNGENNNPSASGTSQRMANSERLARKAYSVQEECDPETASPTSSNKGPLNKKKSLAKFLIPSIIDRRRKSTSEVIDGTNQTISHKHTPAPSVDEVRRRSITPLKTVADELNLDQEGVNLLKASWKVLKGSLTEIGQEIFKELFEQCPELKEVFQFGYHTPNDKTCEEKETRSHVTRFMEVIQTSLNHLEKPSASLFIVLNSLGHVHYRWKERGIRPYHWSVFQMTMITVILSKLSSDFHLNQIRDAWTKLIEMIVHEMKGGYAQAQAKTVSVRSQSICGALLQPPSPNSNVRNRRSSCSIPTVGPLKEEEMTDKNEEEDKD